MAERWRPLPIEKPYYANADEDAVGQFQTAIENGYITDTGTHSRFPGLIERVDLGGVGRVYLHDFADDLVAVCNGHVHRIDRSYTATDVTGVPVEGGRRVIFSKTDRDLLMAAGAQIVRLRGPTTEILSEDAPLASHVAWIEGFTVGIEINSQAFFHSGAGQPAVWNPLDRFAADGNPDNINSMLVTPFRELMLGGKDSMEQFERSASGEFTFFRRWSVNDGVKLPYAILFADGAVWRINALTQLARSSGQIGQVMSADVGRLLESVDNWEDAWLGGYPDKALHTQGHTFIMLSIPNATNVYGTKGITLLYDYRNKRFSTLFGWDANLGAPTGYRAWSHWPLWDKVFIGSNGKVYELTTSTYNHGGDVARWLIRTGHISEGEKTLMNGFRLQVKRGIGGNDSAPTIRVRCSRDGRPFGTWIRRTLGRAGERVQMLEFGAFGDAYTHQFEISCTDDCAIELVKAEVKTLPLGH